MEIFLKQQLGSSFKANLWPDRWMRFVPLYLFLNDIQECQEQRGPKLPVLGGDGGEEAEKRLVYGRSKRKIISSLFGTDHNSNKS